MKKIRGKGTPHPKKTRALRDLTNLQIGRGYEDATTRSADKENRSSESPWLRLNTLHKRVAGTLNKIDCMMVAAHRLGLSNKINDQEVDKFAASIEEVERILLKWDSYFSSAAKRSDTLEMPGPPKEEQLTAKDLIHTGRESESITTSLSSSPLVPSSAPSSSPLFLTPICPARLESIVSDCLASSLFPSTPHSVRLPSQGVDSSPSLLAITPLSPPRSMRSSIGSSDDSFLSTPCISTLIASPADSISPGLRTPLPPPDLLLRYPSLGSPARLTAQNSDFPGLLMFENSPPITRTPVSFSTDFVGLSEPPRISDSDFHTPSNYTQDVQSAAGMCRHEIVDDLTASTVKRLGEKGLEEELWCRLQLGSANAHKFVRHRFVNQDPVPYLQPWDDPLRQNLCDDVDSVFSTPGQSQLLRSSSKGRRNLVRVPEIELSVLPLPPRDRR